MKKMLFTALSAAVLVSLPLASHATTFQYNATLNSANQVPSHASTAFGSASLVYDDLGTAGLGDDLYSIFVSGAGLTGGKATGYHIHQGSAAVNGPVKVFLDAASFTTLLNAGGALFVFGTNVPTPYAGFLSDLSANNAYVNIHNAGFPGGEIRGQLIAAVPEPSTYAMFGLGLGLMGLFARRRAANSI